MKLPSPLEQGSLVSLATTLLLDPCLPIIYTRAYVSTLEWWIPHMRPATEKDIRCNDVLLMHT